MVTWRERCGGSEGGMAWPGGESVGLERRVRAGGKSGELGGKHDRMKRRIPCVDFLVSNPLGGENG